MKNIWAFLLFLIPFSAKGQSPIGFTNVTSHSGLQPYAVGDIFLGYQSGGLAVIVHSSLVVNVDEISTSKEYKVFPNPANHTVRIACTEGETIHDVKLFDVKGNEINVFFDQGLLDLSKEQRGVYILLIDGNKPLKVIIE